MTNVDVCEVENENVRYQCRSVKYLSEISKIKNLIHVSTDFIFDGQMVLILKMIFRIPYLIMDCLN